MEKGHPSGRKKLFSLGQKSPLQSSDYIPVGMKDETARVQI